MHMESKSMPLTTSPLRNLKVVRSMTLQNMRSAINASDLMRVSSTVIDSDTSRQNLAIQTCCFLRYRGQNQLTGGNCTVRMLKYNSQQHHDTSEPFDVDGSMVKQKKFRPPVWEESVVQL
jgi:hypothetical protein